MARYWNGRLEPERPTTPEESREPRLCLECEAPCTEEEACTSCNQPLCEQDQRIVQTGRFTVSAYCQTCYRGAVNSARSCRIRREQQQRLREAA
jgi:hypothetical protein